MKGLKNLVKRSKSQNTDKKKESKQRAEESNYSNKTVNSRSLSDETRDGQGTHYESTRKSGSGESGTSHNALNNNSSQTEEKDSQLKNSRFNLDENTSSKESKTRKSSSSVKSGESKEASEEHLKSVSKKEAVIREETRRLYERFNKRMAAHQSKELYYTVEREAEIDIEQKKLLSAFKPLLKEVKGADYAKEFASFARSVAAYYHIQFHRTTIDLLDQHKYFSLRFGEEKLQEDNIHDFELEDREDQFMNTLNYVMGLADFKLLTQKKAENLYEKYLLNIDISVDKEKLDYKFIERYHRQFPNTNRAEITDYFLIFQRGTGIDEAKKFFYTEKVEVLVRRLKKVIKVKVSSLFPPKFMEWIDMQKKKAKSYSSIKLPKELLSRGLFVATVLFYVWGLFSTLSDPHRSKGIFSAFFGWLNFFLLNGAILGVVAFIFLYNPPFGTEQKDKKKEKKFAKTLRVRKKSTVNSLVDTDEDQFAKKIKRIRLDQLPLYPKDLLVQTTLQEPTFRDVIIIYREIGQKAIRLKRFVDIPLADLELVYPAKAISLNLTDSLIFFVTIIVGLVSVANSSYGENLGDYVYSIALGVGILIARSIYNYNNQKSAYEATLTKTLYEKQVSTDETLLIHLVRNCEEQEVKEALLAFFMLTKEGSQKEDILDYLIEAFLRKYFKKNIDFHVSNALSKLSHIGLVEISPGGLVTAIPLEKAVSTITKKWSEFDIGLKDKSKEGGMVSGAADFVTGWIPGMGKKKSSKTPQKEENSSIKN